MTHTLRISGIDYTVPRYVHRRMARDAWAIALPGYEKVFEDAAYGDTQLALIAASATVREALQLEVEYPLPDCTLELVVVRYHNKFEVHSTIFSSVFVKQVNLVAPVANPVLASELYDRNCSIALNSAEALALLGEAEHQRFVQGWMRSLRNHIYVNNITTVNLASTEAPTLVPRRAMKPLRTRPADQREFWWNEH